MCLAIPSKVVEIKETADKKQTAVVELISGVKREVKLDLIGSVKIGQYVLTHSEHIIQILDDEDDNSFEQMRQFTTMEVEEDSPSFSKEFVETKRVTAQIPKELHIRLKNAAKTTGTSMSKIITQAIGVGLMGFEEEM